MRPAVVSLPAADGRGLRSLIAGGSPFVLAIAAFLLAVTVWLLGERIYVQGGLGGDGVIYARWAKDFSSEVFVKKLDTYYIQRILPPAIVHYGMRLFGAPLTDLNVIHAYCVLSVILYTLMGYVWGRIASLLVVSPAGRWLGFVMLFVNYIMLKYTYFLPVTTDIYAYALGLFMLHAYLTGRRVQLAVLTALGAFVWPLSVYIGGSLLVFPATKKAKDELPVLPVRVLAAIVAAGMTAFAIVGIRYVLRTGPELANGLVDPPYLAPIQRLLPVSYIVVGAYLFLGLTFLLRSSRLIDRRQYLGRPQFVGFVVATFVIGGVRLLQGWWSTGVHVFGVGEMLAITAFTSVAKPGVFLVMHAVFFGPAFLLTVLLWPRVCSLMQRQGVGLTLAILLGLLLSLNSQSRYLLNVFVMVIPFAVMAADELAWKPRFLTLMAGLGVLFSKCWLPMNGNHQYHGRFLEFPDQLLFMTHGPWVSNVMYAVQGVIVLAIGWLIVARRVRTKADAAAPARLAA
jgi:hypothetical protein